LHVLIGVRRRRSLDGQSYAVAPSYLDLREQRAADQEFRAAAVRYVSSAASRTIGTTYCRIVNATGPT